MVFIATSSDRHRQLKTISKLSVVLGTTPHIGHVKEISLITGQTIPSHSRTHSRFPISDGIRDIELHCTTTPFSIRRRLKNFSHGVVALGRGHSTSVPTNKSTPELLYPRLIQTPFADFFSSSNPDKSPPSTPTSSALSPFSAITGSINPHSLSPNSFDDLETSLLFSQEHFDNVYEKTRRVKKMAKLRRHLGECPPTEMVFKSDSGGTEGCGGNKNNSGFSEDELQSRTQSYSVDILPQNTPTIIQEIGHDKMVIESRGQLMRTLRSM